MQELEKILEEIEYLIGEYMSGDVPLGMQDFCAGMKKTQEIIRKHINGLNAENTPEENGIKKGYEDALKEDGVSKEFLDECKRVADKYRKKNDTWIPVEELMPEKNKTVLVCQRGGAIEVAWHDGYRWKTGFSHAEWLWDVVAWRLMPEPYRPERSDNHDGE